MAPLTPGVRVVNAPYFQGARPWSERLRLNSGVEVVEGQLLPREDWRAPSPEEMALLTAPDGDTMGQLALFHIPQRLRSLGWQTAEAANGLGEQGGAAFQRFAGEVLAYLQFKRLPLPPACKFTVVVHAPEQPSTRTGGLTGPIDEGLRGAVNLGDEEAGFVYLNLGDTDLGGPAEGGLLHERARVFLSESRSYPLIRIGLQPGEGFWLSGPLVLDGDTRGRGEIDVRLLLRIG